MKKHRRFTAFILTLVMSVSMLPNAAFADAITESETVVEAETDAAEESSFSEETLYTDESEPEETDESETEADIKATEADTVETESVAAETETETETETEETETEEVLLDAGAAKYSYKITPLLAPFNHYFYVQTDNPDPLSFRFEDKSSVYKDGSFESYISMDYDDFDKKTNLYADVRYEDTKTGRVKGGYIFYGGSSDGGEIVLQEGNGDNWKDTSVKLKLPALMDNVDYLIKTYAGKGSFFDQMDAVQDGFSSICFYSGSWIRGSLTKPNKYWFLATGGHTDQSFYIYSPYDRKDNESLFASAIYPFRYDSLGFPGMMAAVATRLNSAASYEWDDYYHYNVQITYNGETRTYGGAGEITGQGISKDKIAHYFDFSNGRLGLTFDGVSELLKQYAVVKMADDIPRDDALTWKLIWDQVGEKGSWVRFSASHMQNGDGTFDLGDPVFTYLYRQGDGDEFITDEWGVGYSNYFGGDLGYASDAWVDGRYVGKYYIPGATLEDFPESDLILTDVTLPKVSYQYQYEKDPKTSEYVLKYTVTDITEVKKTALFYYNSDIGAWILSDAVFDRPAADYDTLVKLVEEGVLDRKYLDMATITKAEFSKIQVDNNTNTEPPKGLIYDGTEVPGTPFDHTGKKDISGLTVTGLRPEYTYTGSSITPSVTVKDGKKTLVSGKDYKIEYSDNRNVGTASVTIKGIGGYYKSIYREFEIVQADIAKVAEFNVKSSKWDGVQRLEDFASKNITLKSKGVTLKQSVDYYAYTYSHWDDSKDLTGEFTVSVQGEGNYTGSIDKKFYVRAGIIYPLEQPVLKSAETVDSGVKISWEKMAGAAQYRVFRKSGSGGWTKLADTKAVSYTDTTAKSDTTYTYTVRCISSDGKTLTSYYDTKGISCTYYAGKKWIRLAGNGRYDTMQAIVKAGFSKTGGTVLIATGAGFKDALAAAGFAGLSDAPIILTDGKALSSQAEQELIRLKPSKVYIVGGPLAVSDKVKDRIQTVTKRKPQRLAGRNSSETSVKLALEGQYGWSSTAIIATNRSFKDALSAAPLAYANDMPILLADNGKSISNEVLDALDRCYINNIIIVGGTAAVSTHVENQLKNAGFKIKKRLWGSTGVDTSKAIAEYGIKELGMSADCMGVATSQNYPDALAGAAFCGIRESVLILADDRATTNTSFPSAYKKNFYRGYIFGGPGAVGQKTMDLLTKAIQ